ncbi:MAG: hypothetical protein LC772_05735, partial [Chloroflexi bacterium]|nr:hypothetical protein [Chloroflexota bacterium]
MSNDLRPQVSQLPWPAAAASLIAFAVLATASSGYALMGLLGLALLGSYVVSLRLGSNSWYGWLIRLILFGVVLFLNSNDSATGAMMVFNPAVVHSFGELCAVELVVQSWRRRPTGPPGAAPVVLSALIFVAGCDTFDPTFIRVMTPLYTVLVVLALRSFRPRVRQDRGRIAAPAVLGVAALVLALLAGGVTSYGLWTYRSRLMEWSLGLLGGRRPYTGVGVSNEPELGPVFNAEGSSQRILRIDGLSETAHFRMAAFEDYHLGSWGPPADRRRMVAASSADLHADAVGQRIVVTRYDDTRPVVFAPLSAAGIAPAPGSGAEWNRSEGGPVHAGLEGGGLYTYGLVLSATPDFQGPLCTPLDAAHRRRCLAVPAEIDPAVRILARRIGSKPLPEQRVQAVVQYLLSH